jgi:hypothetical protein
MLTLARPAAGPVAITTATWVVPVTGRNVTEARSTRSSTAWVLTEHQVEIAPSTYYAAKTRPASARTVRDVELLEQIRAVHADRAKGRGLASNARQQLLPTELAVY